MLARLLRSTLAQQHGGERGLIASAARIAELSGQLDTICSSYASVDRSSDVLQPSCARENVSEARTSSHAQATTSARHGFDSLTASKHWSQLQQLRAYGYRQPKPRFSLPGPIADLVAERIRVKRKAAPAAPPVPKLEPRPLQDTSVRVGCIATKAGMTQEWDEHGVRVPLTVLFIDDCQVRAGDLPWVGALTGQHGRSLKGVCSGHWAVIAAARASGARQRGRSMQRCAAARASSCSQDAATWRAMSCCRGDWQHRNWDRRTGLLRRRQRCTRCGGTAAHACGNCACRKQPDSLQHGFPGPSSVPYGQLLLWLAAGCARPGLGLRPHRSTRGFDYGQHGPPLRRLARLATTAFPHAAFCLPTGCGRQDPRGARVHGAPAGGGAQAAKVHVAVGGGLVSQGGGGAHENNTVLRHHALLLAININIT